MTLKEYLYKYGMTCSGLARRLACNITYINEVMNGRKVPSEQLARHIELLTNGEVKAETLLIKKSKNDKEKKSANK